MYEVAKDIGISRKANEKAVISDFDPDKFDDYMP